MFPGTNSAGAADVCFGADRRPDPASGCDFFELGVDVPEGFYDPFVGGVQVTLSDFDSSDVDLGVFRRKPDGTRGEFVGGSTNAIPGGRERATVQAAAGAYYVVVVPYTVVPGQAYGGLAELIVTRITPIGELNRRAPPGFPNYRASRDRYISHSEPTIAMDPLDHEHLIAGSKMYEDLPRYLFKIGTYESFDGGRTWLDHDHLPGYCGEEPGHCDPSNENAYRITSDPSIDFDDEGNAYANVLDAPGGTAGFTGFNMTVHVKRPGQPWTDPTTVHDNRNNPVTEQALLDDKNWIAVDNVTAVDGGPNKPRDGKIGTLYICWSFDSSIGVAPAQQIVLMKSVDGGAHWGGFVPDDNTPKQLSQKGAVSGIGCHIAIGPQGEVYVTWYDNQLQSLMQVKSTDRGETFTPARPIATIAGVDEPFAGQSFRNLSIPTSAVDREGKVYVAVASRNAEGGPVTGAARLAEELAAGRLSREELQEALRRPAETERLQQGEADRPGSGADIVLFASSDGGDSYSGPVRVNQDARESDADQFQPWMDVTDRGQVNVSYFDRRNDPANFFIDTYLSRSNDGGKTFHDVRASRSLWDPRINPPISPSGEFIGDYQGLVADDDVAIPFWNDTQLANLPEGEAERSPYQEVLAARIPNTPVSAIERVRDGARIRRRSRARFVTFAGRASDPSGGKVTRVRVAVRRKRKGRCSYYSSRRKRLVRGSCGRPRYLRARGTEAWSLRVRRAALARGGGYAVLSRAANDAGAVEREQERGRNLSRFRVR